MAQPRKNVTPRGDDDSGIDDTPRRSQERDSLADEREASLDARQRDADARDAVKTGRDEEVRGILANADERDIQADARDSLADSRDATASLNSFIHDEEFLAGLQARRSAALDRSDSKSDRVQGAADRTRLAESKDTGSS